MANLRITTYCIIRNSQLIIDGNTILDVNPGTNFRLLSKSIYNGFNMNYPKFYKMDNLSKLGFLSAEAVLRESNILSNYGHKEIGIFIQNANSSLDTDKTYFETIKNSDNYFPSPSIFVYTLPNIMIGEISIKNKITGEHACFISEKFDAKELYDYIKCLFDKGSIKCCLAGWVDLIDNDYDSFICLIEQTDSQSFKEGIEKRLIFNEKNLNKLYFNKEN